MVISLLQVFGFYFKTYNSLQNMYIASWQIIKSIVVFAGYSVMFYLALQYIFKWLDNAKYKMPKNKYFDFFFNKHPFWSTFIFLLICYLPTFVTL